MRDWAKAAQASAQKTVTSPLTQRDFVIRKLTSSELMEAGINPLIPTEKPEKHENEAMAQAAALAWLASNSDKVTLAQTRHVLLNGIVEPKVVYGDEAAVPEGSVHVRWIAEDEDWLHLSVLEFSGHSTPEQRQKLRNLLKNDHGSETSTKSEKSSESSQAS